ncbi:MAG: glycoside hydrolase family 31 protein [Clostridiales bacterium]|jgi:alpha-glucosidase (family GH31 glycosyl hydrolase)|nr:glycoside hydrolase family 31 protein [Clostridiales bacterium]
MSRWKKLPGNPEADPRAVASGEGYRVTVLASRLIRLEYSEKNVFTDLPTKAVINRLFPVPEFRVSERPDFIEISTAELILRYNKGPFSANGLEIEVLGGVTAYNSVWRYAGEPEMLGGTARTLDGADGEIRLFDSVFSVNGYAVMDDSNSFVVDEDGWVRARASGGIDLYFFGYGRDFLGGLKDFYALSGATPMLPRWALGNWWSRFHAYSEDGYKELIERFKKEEVPLCVSVLDMDWHLTEVDPKYGSGWTGYTWNKKLFPDPERFMRWLHEQGLKITLNVHPADGVRAFEEKYLEMAGRLGVDAENERKIEFDASNPDFMEAYFEILNRPNEKMGVDFWWLDWQQEGGSKHGGLDPLWILNHYHFMDMVGRGERPLILSRYAGPGSHRYPLGFSGDSCITWKSLDFQPYFTSASSNAGYAWWSHDIGGHFKGMHSDELQLRWLQFGVFSPIMRLHSSSNPFTSKVPWRFDSSGRDTAKRFMRLRHQLVPYLYAMMERAHRMGEPLIQPLYYKCPEERAAYSAKNEYFFGTELLVCPMTTPCDPKTKLAEFSAWLPQGKWYDVFSGWEYEGGRLLNLYRPLESIPVLAKAGAIVPLSRDMRNGAQNPENLEVWIFAGNDGEFELYEDNGMSGEGLEKVVTRLKLDSSGFSILPPVGDYSILPVKRRWRLCFYGFKKGSFACDADERRGMQAIEVELGREGAFMPIEASLEGRGKVQRMEDVFSLLSRAEIEYEMKALIYQIAGKKEPAHALMGELQALGLEPSLHGALVESISSWK